MRRFFNSALLNENAPIFFVDFLLGHQLDATHEAYYRASPEKLKDEYAKYVSFLTIEKTMDPTEHPAFIQMKEDKEAYRRITDIMTQERQDERSELKELRAEIEKIKQSQEVTEITLELQKRDPELISTVLEAIKAMKS
jgi:hypothetical protein